jgi:hypothetical protein
MIWQDYVFTIGNICLMLALYTEKVHKRKERLALVLTVPLTLWLAAFAVGFATLNLIGSAVSFGLSAVIWGVMVLNDPNLNKR